MKTPKKIQPQFQQALDLVKNCLISNFIEIDNSFDTNNIKCYIVDQNRGRAYLKESMFTIPLFAYNKGLEYFTWYVAHELSHILRFKKYNDYGSHDRRFYEIFTQVCPTCSQHHELHYKKSAVRFGVSKKQSEKTPTMKKTRGWIHFIGANYYSIDDYRQEAMTIGISRAVAPNVLKQMNLGDIIVLAQKDDDKTKIFGYFRLTNIIGMGGDLVEEMKRRGVIHKSETFKPVEVERGCGSYTITSSYDIGSDVDFMEVIRNADNEQLGRVMIGGKYFDLPGGIEYIVSEIPFRRGFRKFDWDVFEVSVDIEFKRKPGRKYYKVKGFFYDFENLDKFNSDVRVVRESDKPNNPKLFEIKDYQLN